MGPATDRSGASVLVRPTPSLSGQPIGPRRCSRLFTFVSQQPTDPGRLSPRSISALRRLRILPSGPMPQRSPSAHGGARARNRCLAEEFRKTLAARREPRRASKRGGAAAALRRAGVKTPSVLFPSRALVPFRFPPSLPPSLPRPCPPSPSQPLPATPNHSQPQQWQGIAQFLNQSGPTNHSRDMPLRHRRDSNGGSVPAIRRPVVHQKAAAAGEGGGVGFLQPCCGALPSFPLPSPAPPRHLLGEQWTSCNISQWTDKYSIASGRSLAPCLS